MKTIAESNNDGLYTGDFPRETQEIVITGPAEFMRGDVLALADGTTPVLVDSTLSNGGQNVVGILCRNVSLAAGETATTAMYVKGSFNQRRLRFGGNDTIEKHLRRMTEIGLIVRETRV